MKVHGRNDLSSMPLNPPPGGWGFEYQLADSLGGELGIVALQALAVERSPASGICCVCVSFCLPKSTWWWCGGPALPLALT